MTFREFYTKRTPKFILLRGVIAYALFLLIGVPLLWIFAHDYLIRKGIFFVLCMAAVPTLGLSLLNLMDRQGLPPDHDESKPMEKKNDA
jgi:hypothetical protein